jgi:hypothetical protein
MPMVGKKKHTEKSKEDHLRSIKIRIKRKCQMDSNPY